MYSSISGNVDTQKNQGLKPLIVLWFSSYMQAFRPWVSKKFSENRTCRPETNLFRCSGIGIGNRMNASAFCDLFMSDVFKVLKIA